MVTTKTKPRNYLEFLRSHFKSLTQRRANYSQNAFARDLGLSPARLSQILSGKSGLSVTMARKIAQELALNEIEAQWFVDSVTERHSRSLMERERARVRMRKAKTLN